MIDEDLLSEAIRLKQYLSEVGDPTSGDDNSLMQILTDYIRIKQPALEFVKKLEE